MEGESKEVANAGESERDQNSESATSQSDSNNPNPTSKRHRLSRAVRELLANNNNEFMNNFDPECSNREKRKLNRKFNLEAKKTGLMHDENGVLTASQKDSCDCLLEDCPGCHFPCPKCRSCKCGVECRVNRKWSYEVVEDEGELSMRKTNPPGTELCKVLLKNL